MASGEDEGRLRRRAVGLGQVVAERGCGRGLWLSAAIGQLEVSRGGADAVRGLDGESTS